MPRKISVLNEYAQVDKILKSGFSRGEFNYNDLTLLSKKFFNDGLNTKEIKDKLIEFCFSQDENFNLVLHEETIKLAIKNGEKYNLRSSKGNIPVYKKELDKIKNLDFKLYKILFVMLVLSRHNKFSSVRRVDVKKRKSGSHYVNKDFLDILRYSGYKSLTLKEVNSLKYRLDGELGLISASTLGKELWQVLFAEDESNSNEVVVLVTDIEKILDFIPVYCLDCGKLFERKGKKERCLDCYPKYLQKIKKESKNKKREKDNCS
jgi:hypothetical protein